MKAGLIAGLICLIWLMAADPPVALSQSSVYQAKKTLAPITVDGALGESVWTTDTNVSKLVVGASSNNTVTYAALWDATYLYVGVRVLDSNLFNDTSGSTNVWKDDSVEVYIDANNNNGTTYDSFDRQFTKGYNDTTLVSNQSTTGVLHGWAAISGGYTIELAIPWSNLGVTGASGLTIGFDVGCNDDDNGGATRENQLMWNGTSSNYNNTSAFGDLTLVEPGTGGGPTGVAITSPAAVPAASGYILPDALVTVTASATNATSVQFKYGATVIGTDANGADGWSVTWDVGLGAAGVIPPVGQHMLTVVATNASSSTTSAGTPVIVELFAGVNTHIGQGHAPQPIIDRMIEVGANLWRDQITWGAMETTQNVYNWGDAKFVAIESAVSQGNLNGVSGHWTGGYANGLYPNQSLDGAAGAPGRTAFANFGKALAQRFGNDLRLHSLYNEYAGGHFGFPAGWDFNDATPARFNEIQKVSYPAIKSSTGNPRAIVIGPVNVRANTHNSDWLTELRDLPGGGGQYLDWVDMHTYPPNGQATVGRRPENSTRWARDEIYPIFGAAKPIIITEYGARINSETPTRVLQAEELARAYMSIRTAPNIRGLVWYELRDHPNGTQFGLCDQTATLTPWPSFWSFQDIAPIFRKALYYGYNGPATLTEATTKAWLLKFKDTDGDVYMAWREEDGPTSLTFSFTASAAGSLQVRPVKTTSTPPGDTAFGFSSGSDSVSIPLTTMPKFIRVPAGVTLTPDPSYNFSANPIP